MKLWEIDDQIEAILAKVAGAEGEITEDVEKELDALELQLQEKLLSCALYYQGELAEAAAVEAMAKKLTERAKRHKNRAEWLLGYMTKHAPADEKFRIRDPRVEVKWQKTERVEEVEPDEEHSRVDPAFIRVKQTMSVDKAAARPLLKQGRQIAGLTLVAYRALKVTPRTGEIEEKE